MLRGHQDPSVRLSPRASNYLDADDAIFLGSRYGLTADPWQEIVLRDWLGRRRDNKWSASRCGLAVPRQNGKNGALEIRELFGMVELGEKFLHTAHEVKTARKAFLRLCSFFENKRRYPELAELVETIRKTNGQEAIILTNGGSVEFVARSKGSGRGFTVDVLVMDEAQELTDEALAALLPTISSAPLGNPQQIYTGTPPGPKASGEVFTRVHDEGVEGKSKRLSWLQWSAPKFCDADDRANWAIANPTLGIRLAADVIVDERASLTDDDFARERLGIWDEKVVGGFGIPRETWEALIDNASQITGNVQFAVDMTPNRDRIDIAVAGYRSDGLPHIEIVETLNTTADAIERLRVLSVTYGASIVLDPIGPIGSIVPDLQEHGIELVIMRANDAKASAGRFYDACMTNGLRHIGQPELTNALLAAKRRVLGDAFAFARSDPAVPISPIVAASEALWGLTARNDTPVDMANQVW